MMRSVLQRDVTRILAIAAGVVLVTELSVAEPRFWTPAEIELRRIEVAARLVVLAEEEALLQRRIAGLQEQIALATGADRLALEHARTQAETRLSAIPLDRTALNLEAAELAAVVTRNPTGPLARGEPRGLTPVQIAGGASQVTAGNAFNPAITVIPDALYYNDNARSRAPDLFRGTHGFIAPGADVETDRPPRGFSLREVELAFSGAVDPYFDVWATFGISESEIEPEEVYVQTRRLLPGVQARVGQFFSGIGYLNRQHPHQWDFADQALPYEALFGPNLADVGVQVTWLPAIPFYTQLGFEALQGDNGLIANQLTDAYPEFLEETPGPRLFTGFVKVSPDLGYSNTLQVGLSGGRSRSHHEAETTDPSADVFAGTAWFVGTDWVWRRDSPRPYGERDLTVQGEYFFRSKSLELVSGIDPLKSKSRQDGLYAQLVYGVAPRWTIGGRFEVIGLRNKERTSLATLDFDAATRLAANVTFNPTEFSRLRVQYNHGRVPDGDPPGIHQVYVQLQMSLGVHGAHAF
jgi:hypothetical protein